MRDAALPSPPWVAYTEHDHARMLLRRGRPTDRTRARGLASQSLATAQRLGMARLAYEARTTLSEASL